MAEDKKTVKTFTVLAEGGLTLDRLYKKGQKVELSDNKTIKFLTEKKVIK